MLPSELAVDAAEVDRELAVDEHPDVVVAGEVELLAALGDANQWRTSLVKWKLRGRRWLLVAEARGRRSGRTASRPWQRTGTSR